MVKNTRRLKYKNDTADIIAEVTRRMNIAPLQVQKALQYYWQDVGIVFTHMLGYGFYVHNFCHFLIYMKSQKSYCNHISERIRVMHYMLDRYHLKISYRFEIGSEPPPPIEPSKRELCWQLGDLVTRLVMLHYTLKLYEDEVLSVYPKKYRPKRIYLDRLIGRLEEFYHLPLAEFPVYISHPIQEVFVQGLRRKGVLPNPLVYKDTQVQPMWLHYLSKDSLSEVQLPFRFLDEAKP